MDPGVQQLVVAAVTLITAGAVAAWVGGRRGLADVEARSDAETKKLVDALEGRVQVLEAALRAANEMSARQDGVIAAQEARIRKLEAELDVERRITARLRSANGNTP